MGHWDGRLGSRLLAALKVDPIGAPGSSCARALQRLMANEARALGYAGRPVSASTAPGSTKVHAREQAELLDQAFAPPTIARRWRKRLVKRRKAK